MSEWEEVIIGEHIDLISGYAFKSVDFLEERTEYSLPVIKIKNVANGDVNLKDVVYHKYNSSLDKFILSEGDVLIAMTGNHPQAQTQVVGDVSRYKLKEKALLNQRVGKIIIKGETDLDFIYYLFKNDDVRFNLANQSSGSANQANISKGDILGLILSIPLPNEQIAIASVLKSLDNKIDLLLRQNITLEKMAETLFRQWFVEEAKEEWENCLLEDLCSQINSGGTPSTKVESYYNGSINWYSTKEFNDNFLFESSSKITEDGLRNSSAKLFPKGTVVMAIYAAPTVGRLGILGNKAAFNQAACGLIANDKICCKEFIYLFLKNKRDELNAMASGSAQQNLNVGKIKSYPAFIPDSTSMEQFKLVAIPMFDKIEKNALKVRTLTALKDTLLPKLMNREITVEP